MEVVKEFYAMTIIYMHSSMLDVSAWLLSPESAFAASLDQALLSR
jgi:hypothetical protein